MAENRNDKELRGDSWDQNPMPGEGNEFKGPNPFLVALLIISGAGLLAAIGLI